MTLEVRPVEPDDHTVVLEIARSLAAWFRPLDQMALVIDLRVHEGLVAVERGRIVGFLTFHLLAEGRAEISWFGVLPEMQSRGAGRRLLQEVEAMVVKRGVRVLEVNTVPADHDRAFGATNSFYLRNGFRIKERNENFYAYGRPGVLLEKEIGGWE